MGRLFGTDGARGVANSELTCELSMQIGRAAAMVLTENLSHRPKVMIGMDTRASSEMLEASIAAGLCSVGADVLLLGVVPTPAVAFLVKEYGYDAGVMISASHNPCEYNGIKIFQSTGYKLPDELENEIESIILDDAKVPPVMIGGDVGRITRSDTAADDYITIDVRCENLKIAIDCANGSSSVSAKRIFESLGADCIIINAEPNGVNINADCGSTHMDGLRKCVIDNHCDLGFAFDGDADRMLAVDNEGNVVDGDQVIALCAKYMKSVGTLKKDTAVVTVMSNMGFFKFCDDNGMYCEKTKVGDRYVLEKMLDGGYNLGGEQSGHIIFLDEANTGDGQLSGAKVLEILAESGKKMSELASVMEHYPQVMINVKISPRDREVWKNDSQITDLIEHYENELGDSGRILVRESGTEPVIRVMVEAATDEICTEYVNQVVNVMKEQGCVQE